MAQLPIGGTWVMLTAYHVLELKKEEVLTTFVEEIATHSKQYSFS